MNFGTLSDEILSTINRLNDAPTVVRVGNLIRSKLFQICQQFSVAELRAKTTIDFTSSAYSTGMLLPSDLLGIDMVRDSNEDEFFERNRSDIEDDEFGYRFYRYHPSETGLFLGSDLSVANAGTDFTSADLTADEQAVDGEYVRFGSGMEYYLISTDDTPFSFTPTYYGETINEGEFVIRPPETQRMVILSASEAVLQDRSMDIYYWRAPSGLYRAADRIPLASHEYLQLLVYRSLPEAKERRPVNQGEMDKALATLIKMNPSFPRSANPRDKHNNIFSFNKDMYSRRGE